jgi:hypothetical protein
MKPVRAGSEQNGRVRSVAWRHVCGRCAQSRDWRVPARERDPRLDIRPRDHTQLLPPCRRFGVPAARA